MLKDIYLGYKAYLASVFDKYIHNERLKILA